MVVPIGPVKSMPPTDEHGGAYRSGSGEESTAEFGALLREPAPQPRRLVEPGDFFDDAFRG